MLTTLAAALLTTLAAALLTALAAALLTALAAALLATLAAALLTTLATALLLLISHWLFLLLSVAPRRRNSLTTRCPRSSLIEKKAFTNARLSFGSRSAQRTWYRRGSAKGRKPVHSDAPRATAKAGR
ncbi:hypothetical protein [Pararhizobium sp. DWP3-4]|uniref:hypothetical protein n=1 Tax=Pararhizobium sp. DWP3-4 TaxID=2804565 RepID=UPI003CEDB69F